MQKKVLTTAALLAAAVGTVNAQTLQAPMMEGRNGAVYNPLITVGEAVPHGDIVGDVFYQFVGLPDGIGAFELDANTVRVYVNHEFGSGAGGEWQLDNGTVVSSGARVSYFDIDKNLRQVTQGGQAIKSIVDAGGNTINSGSPVGGFNRYCASAMFGTTEGFTHNIYFMGEETDGGRQYAIDTQTGTAYEMDWAKAAWENVTVIPTVGTAQADKSVFLIGDDRGDAPALMYVGQKNAAGNFLEQNGMVGGQLYAWVSDGGDAGPIDFNGTGNSRTGTWVAIDNTGSGDFGLATQGELDDRYTTAGAFKFSRPEDVAYDPISFNEGRAVMNSTGRSTPTSDDLWGTIYELNIDLDTIGTGTITGSVSILNDGRETEDLGIRSPDNLDWADDGLIYIQEDSSIGGFGDVSGLNALIWRLDPESGQRQILAEITPYVAEGFVDDGDLNDLGDWESSGILDVSSLFGEAAGTLFLANVQSHSLDPDPNQPIYANTVEGGQLAFLDVSNASPIPEPGSIALLTLGTLLIGRRRKA